MSERNGIKNQFDPLLDKLHTRIEELEQENADLCERVVQLEEALQAVYEYLAPRVEGRGITGRTIILPKIIQALSTQPSDYRHQIVDETIEKVAVLLENDGGYTYWVRVAVAETLRKLKGTL